MTDPVDLTGLSPSDFKKFLDSFDHVFSDCDGVIWSTKPFPDSGEFFKRMRAHGKTVHFVSNNSLRTRDGYELKFTAAGIDNGYENLALPSFAIAEYLKSINFNKKVYCVTCSQTVHVLQATGFTCEIGPEVGSDNYQDYIQYLTNDPEIGAVVFDSDFKINLPKLYRALTYLKRPDVLFLGGATDRYVPFMPGFLVLGTGAFTDIVIEESKREPILLAKPGKLFGEFAMRQAGVKDPSRVLFIGDMIDQDVGLGKATGFKTLLLLTNLKKEAMETHKIKPDYYAMSLQSIVPLL